MSRGIVAVSMRLAPATGYHEDRDAISHDWCVFISRLGLSPVLIPNVSEDVVPIMKATGVERILLTNGDSLGPLDNEKDGPRPSRRDMAEFAILDHAVAHEIPVLGVCRGLQAINVYFGGRLTRNLEQVTGEAHVAQTHEVELSGGNRYEVNSYHDEGVLEGQLAEPLRGIAFSAGGVVEALEHHSLPIWAVQWHPERTGAPQRLDRQILERWLRI
ncbi:MAG: C26 family cysteine hydrolase domain-containing family [Xanthomonadales bacterium]|nr:C26 family cysteine hydrolase domain-containing family [Xanthomonadales bacterium]NNL95808.1 C26 family cysteine hydrolase domain-containing family [Xanthomonadales bacterium]